MIPAAKSEGQDSAWTFSGYAIVFGLICELYLLFWSGFWAIVGDQRIGWLVIWCGLFSALVWLTKFFFTLLDPGYRKVFLHAIGMAASWLMVGVNSNLALFLKAVRATTKPLFDVGFAVIPEIPTSSLWIHSSEVLQLLLIFWHVWRCLKMEHAQRCHYATTCARLIILAQLFRSTHVYFTQLPGFAPDCRLVVPPSSLSAVLSRIGPNQHCDLMFSGSTSTMVMLTCLVLHRTRSDQYSSSNAWRVAAWAYFLAFCIATVAARKHYSVDCFLSSLICVLMYSHFKDSWTNSWTQPKASLGRIPEPFDVVEASQTAPLPTSDPSHHPNSKGLGWAAVAVVGLFVTLLVAPGAFEMLQEN